VNETIIEQMRQLVAPESDAITAARGRAAALAPPPPEIGALLRWAATSCEARQVVEVGSCGGVSGLWLLTGLAERGVLTSIDPDPHAHALADEAFAQVAAGTRVRSILGEPATVLPRLSDGVYDLALLQARPAGNEIDLDHVRRLLRIGGMLVVRGVLRRGEHGDAHARLLAALVEDDHFVTTVLPVDDGLVLATRTSPDGDATA
jgi:predicted O-methyltransferase YrrM